jgi:hypothetical protein
VKLSWLLHSLFSSICAEIDPIIDRRQGVFARQFEFSSLLLGHTKERREMMTKEKKEKFRTKGPFFSKRKTQTKQNTEHVKLGRWSLKKFFNEKHKQKVKNKNPNWKASGYVPSLAFVLLLGSVEYIIGCVYIGEINIGIWCSMSLFFYFSVPPCVSVSLSVCFVCVSCFLLGDSSLFCLQFTCRPPTRHPPPFWSFPFFLTPLYFNHQSFDLVVIFCLSIQGI